MIISLINLRWLAAKKELKTFLDDIVLIPTLKIDLFVALTLISSLAVILAGRSKLKAQRAYGHTNHQ